MPGKRVKIGAEFRNIDRDMSRGLRAVDEKRDAVLFAQRADFFRRHDRARDVRDVCHDDERRVAAKRGFNPRRANDPLRLQKGGRTRESQRRLRMDVP